MLYRETFSLTLTQMLMIFSLILVGFLLRKKNIVPENSGITISRIETFVLIPALIFHNQLTNCNIENFLASSKLILCGLGLVLIAIIAACPLSTLFVKNSSQNREKAYQRNIYKYALTFGNSTALGTFIVLGIWGDEMLFKHTMFNFFPILLAFSWGLYVLIPKEYGEKSLLKNLKKGLTAPTVIALVAGIICGLCDVGKFLPEFVMSALSNASNCMGPLAMILTGVVIGGYDFKSLWTNKKVYAVTFLRLIVIPAILVLALKAMGMNDEILTLALIAYATPAGMNVIVYPATYGGDTKTGASMTIVSQMLSVITIPIMYLLLIEVI